MELQCQACHNALGPTDTKCSQCGALRETQESPAGQSLMSSQSIDTEEPAGFSLFHTQAPGSVPSGTYEGDEDDPMLGQQLGNFKLQRRIGEGGFGVVYQAEQVFLKQPFAVKILHLNKRAAPEVIERFRREALAIARLRHANVVQISDFGLLPEERGFYLVMELLEGQSLADAIASGEAFSPERINNIVKQLCEVLYEAHDLGIYHRDMKPANVFLLPHRRGHDVVKLLDFGVASMLEEEVTLTQSATILGSPAYMSPEQSQGNASSLDGRSDLYSLGVVLYELLVGRLPFESDSLTGMLFKHAFETPPPLSQAAPETMWVPELESFLLAALAKSPDDRPANADQFAEACDAALQAQSSYARSGIRPDDKATVATPAPAFHTEQPPKPSHRSWLFVAALLLLLPLGVGAWWFTQSHHREQAQPRPQAATTMAPQTRQTVNGTAHKKTNPPLTPTSNVPSQKRTTRRVAPKYRRLSSITPKRQKRRPKPKRTRRKRVSKRKRARRRGILYNRRQRELVTLLNSPNPYKRRQAARSLCFSQRGVDIMMEIMRNGTGRAKRGAMSCFEDRRTIRAIPLIIKHLSLPNLLGRNFVRCQQALMKIGQPAIVPLLKAAKRSKHPQSQRNILLVLRDIGRIGVPALIRLMPSMQLNNQVFIINSLNIAQRYSPAARALIIKTTRNQHPQLRATATYVLRYMNCCQKRVIPIFIRQLRDPSPAVRYNALQAFFRLTRSPMAQRALPALHRLLFMPPTHHHRKILQLLKKISPYDRTIQVLHRLLNSNANCRLKQKAVHSLTSIARANQAALPILQKATQSDCRAAAKSAQQALDDLRQR